MLTRDLKTEVDVIYEVYIDVLAVNNFLADLAALLAVHLFRRKRIRAWRLLAGAGAGTLCSSLLFAACKSPAAYLLLVHFLVNPVVLIYCFREKSKQDFFYDLCVGYFAFLIIAGAVEWLYAGGFGLVSYETAQGAALLLLPVAALWLRRKMKNRTKYLEVGISHKGKQITLRALADSGNLLADPYTGKPVSMIDRDVYEAAYGAPQSMRLIPYESLGCRHGLLEAVTVECLSYVSADGADSIKEAVLGLADHALFEKKTYQMIMNPQENVTGGRNEKDG